MFHFLECQKQVVSLLEFFFLNFSSPRAIILNVDIDGATHGVEAL